MTYSMDPNASGGMSLPPEEGGMSIAPKRKPRPESVFNPLSSEPEPQPDAGPQMSVSAESRVPEDWSEQDLQFQQDLAAYKARNAGKAGGPLSPVQMPADQGRIKQFPFPASYNEAEELYRTRKITLGQLKEFAKYFENQKPRKVTYLRAREAGMVPRQQTVVQEGVESNRTARKLDEAEKMGLEAITQGLREEGYQADRNAAIYDKQAADLQQQVADQEARKVAIDDQMAAYREQEAEQLQRIASGRGSPGSLFGSVGEVGRFLAKVMMFMKGPEAILQAAQADTQRLEAESRVRANAYSNLVAELKSSDAAAATIEGRRLALADARLKAASEKAKSRNVQNRIAEARAAVQKGIWEAQARRERALQGTMTLTEVYDPGSPGGAIVTGGSKGMTPTQRANLTAAGAGGGGGGEVKTFPVRLPTGEQVWSTDQKTQDSAVAANQLNQIDQEANGLIEEIYDNPLDVRLRIRNRERLQQLETERTLAIKEAVKMGALDKGALEVGGQLGFGNYTGRTLPRRDRWNANKTGRSHQLNRMQDAIKQRVYKDPQANEPYLRAPPRQNRSMVTE